MDINVPKQQCCGKTAKGTQCTRSACENEKYCKTHMKKYSKTKHTNEDRKVVSVVYHTHPPSSKIYPNCPRCQLKQTKPSSLFLQEKVSLQTEGQIQLCEMIPS